MIGSFLRGFLCYTLPMTGIDDQTLSYYQAHAAELAARYNSCECGISSFFPFTFSPGSRVFEIGCGSGRDLARLLAEGFVAEGVEPCRELIDEAERVWPELRGRIHQDSLPTLSSLPEDVHWDGVLCSSVLMHIPKEHVFDAAFSIRRLLARGGWLLLSVPRETLQIDPNTGRDAQGRLFNGIVPEEWQLIFERLGFLLEKSWERHDGLGREGRSWTILHFFYAGDGTLRPLDQIESVINKDRKVATYKLALFRALADIALMEYNRAVWLPGKKVGIPVRAITEKWIEYFWPIVAAEYFIPQIQGEVNGASTLAFRPLFSELVALYKPWGGQAGFFHDYLRGRINDTIRPLVKKLLSKLDNTIVSGPVTYSGGALLQQAVFSWDSSGRQIVMDASLWRELTYLGRWIRDAAILRWAELTAHFNEKGSYSISQILDVLLQEPVDHRDMDQSRKVYESLEELECVWSGKNLEDRRFEVDHIIPFTLWRNNDLWNMMPAEPKYNLLKSDKLPGHELLVKRKEQIIYYWEATRQRLQDRFQKESERFSSDYYLFGRNSNWQGKLFAALMEAVESTAIHFSTARWVI